MDLSLFLTDVKVLTTYICHRSPEEAVTRWSNASCDDYQLPIGCVLGFLTGAVAPLHKQYWQPKVVSARTEQLCNVVADMVNNSHLSLLLEFDKNEHRLGYKKEIPYETKVEVADFVYDNSPPPIIN